MNIKETSKNDDKIIDQTHHNFSSKKSNIKIGIVTFHHIDNYGATLQAYALHKFLKQHGYDVQIIDYRPSKAIKYYTRGLSPINKDFSLNKRAFGNIARAWRMRQFLRSQTKLSQKKYYSKKGLEYFRDKYDVVICGSDQIWCLDSFRGFDTSYFLDFVSQDTRRISYAASFGNSTSLKNHKEEICKLVEKFQTILVRDSNSKNIINTECNVDATRVLDPTFIAKYDDIISPVNIKDNYLLIYNQAGLTPAQEEFVNSIAEAKSLTIVSVGKYNKIAHTNLVSASPKEWVSLFSQAAYIVTNTYHGTIFSIIFKRLFTVFGHDKKSQKLTDLLDIFDLSNRMLMGISEVETVNAQLHDIDYESVSKILTVKISESQNYLLEALAIEKTNNKLEAAKE
ncbi:MAG: polysaccharide pyruvyl transferase family protein [Rivularia sp. (in: cyanobacteria)]